MYRVRDGRYVCSAVETDGDVAAVGVPFARWNRPGYAAVRRTRTYIRVRHLSQTSLSLKCMRMTNDNVDYRPTEYRLMMNLMPGRHEQVQERSQEFATREQKGVWGRKSPSGVQGQSPGGDLGAKPEARDKC